MTGMLAFGDRYPDEQACIAALASLRWPQGFLCAACGGRRAYQLRPRPRVFECAGCARQHSVTAGTVLHRTKTPLRKWFLAAYWLARDKRGVSAVFLARELDLRYATAWLIGHKLRHALAEGPAPALAGLVEVDESYYGGRGKPESRGRSLADPNKSLLVIAVEKVPVTAWQGRGIKQSGFVAGSARLAILPAATGDELGGFVGASVKPGARVITDGFQGYSDLDKAFRHTALVQKTPKNAETILPVIHVLFSNIKAWLNGTFHGVSAKHLPRYATEWTYRFNRRGRITNLDNFVLRRAVQCQTITYRQLINGFQPKGVAPAASG